MDRKNQTVFSCIQSNIYLMMLQSYGVRSGIYKVNKSLSIESSMAKLEGSTVGLPSAGSVQNSKDTPSMAPEDMITAPPSVPWFLPLHS